MSIAVQSLRLPAALVDRLSAHGITSAQEALKRGQQTISAHCRAVGVPESEYVHVWNEITQATIKPASQGAARPSALSMLQEQQNQVPIRTFSQNLDNLLEGGIFTNSGMIEFCGSPGSGKTQVCMQLCASVQIPKHLGGLGGGALYLDTEGSFMGERFHEIATATVDHLHAVSAQQHQVKRQKLDEESEIPTVDKMMNGVYVFRLFDVEEQIATIQKIPLLLEQAKSKGTPIKLIVVDSMAFLFRHGFSKDAATQNMQLRTKWLLTLSQHLTNMATEYDIAVVLTNHMTTKMNPIAGQSNIIPALGDSWAHQPNWRIQLEAVDLDQKSVPGVGVRATLLKNPMKGRQQTHFMVTTGGLRDPQ